MDKLNVLKEKDFDREKAQKEVVRIIAKTEQDIKKLTDSAEEKKIYLIIDNKREINKRLKKHFEFLYLGRFQYSYQYSTKEIIDRIEYEYNHRFETVLREIGFISIDEKNKTIKARKKYNFLDYDELYRLKYVSCLDLKKDNIEIIKEYKNLNIEFRFKELEHYDIFKTLVFWSNETTNNIINNAPDELIKEYKTKRKESHYNELYVLYEWAKINNLNTHIKPMNKHLINKAWVV